MKRFVQSLLRSLGYDLRRIPRDRIFFNEPFEAQRVLLDGLGVRDPTIFDVGAYLGQTSAQYRSLFPTATIYCFEPFPESFSVIKNRFSSDSRVKPSQLAIAETSGRKTLYINRRHATNSLLPRPVSARRYYPSDARPTATLEVPTGTLDEFVRREQIEHIDILKLDVQGGEMAALQGAVETLQREKASLIYLEIMFIPHYRGATLFHGLWEFLERYRYHLFDIFDLHRARNGQLRFGDALFLSQKVRSDVVDQFPEEA